MKKKWTALMAVILLFAVAFSGSVTVSARSSADDGLYLKFYKPETKDGRTYFPMTIYNRDAYYSKAKYQLQNGSGKVLATWKEVPINPRQDYNQRPWCKMANYPAGNCYFHVYLQQPWDKEKWYHWKEKIYNNNGGITFRQTTLRRTDSGKLVPKISVNYKNLQGKYLYLEIDDSYGNTVYKKKISKPLKNKDGQYWFSWSGRVGDTLYPSGYYHVRVGFSGGKWTETDTYLDFSKAR